MKAENDVEKFWAETEAKLGERVLVYSLGQFVAGYGDVHPGTWGLFFVSETALHFQTFQSENWFSSLLRGRRRSKPSESEMEFHLPLSCLKSVEVTRQKSWLKRLFAPEPPVVHVPYVLPTGRQGELLFAMDLKIKEFVDGLRAQILRSD